jgi:hypothetical protein
MFEFYSFELDFSFMFEFYLLELDFSFCPSSMPNLYVKFIKLVLFILILERIYISLKLKFLFIESYDNLSKFPKFIITISIFLNSDHLFFINFLHTQNEILNRSHEGKSHFPSFRQLLLH